MAFTGFTAADTVSGLHGIPNRYNAVQM